jgi:POT family proton-dependent oligopeptide transporter
VNIASTFRDMRTGFHPSFWVANVLELFERFAYYGQNVVLVIFIRNVLGLSEVQAGQLSSIFGGLIYFLPIFAGTFVDKYGFRKSFTIAFSILALGYFAIGTTGIAAFQSFYRQADLFWVLAAVLAFTAIGGSFIKPSVLGTVARTSKPETKSLGFAIYYMLVNIGAAVGPLIAFFVRGSLGMQYVYVISAIVSAAMLAGTLLYFKEPPAREGELGGSIGEKLRNLVVVLMNGRFMLFLVIFSIFWVMFWQIFIIIPLYVNDYVSADAPFEIISSIDAWGIILFQVLVNRLTKTVSTRNAIVVGFAVSAVSWLLIAASPTVPVIIAAMFVFSFGEMTQAPRYYEYISDIAPTGQLGLFQGYAFLPIAIGYAIGGTFGGWLYRTYAVETHSPTTLWIVLFAIGAFTTVLMWLYTKLFTVKRSDE